MRKIVAITLVVLCVCIVGYTQSPSTSYTKTSYMIPMRDGVKLYTVVFSPTGNTKDLPFLIQRTPYGASGSGLVDGAEISVDKLGPYIMQYAQEGYHLIFQDIRGKFASEGTFEMNRPIYHLSDKSKADESTDAWDTIDWLIKNIKHNNGSAGIHGISYAGYLALDASVDPHPALKASSPQASPTDMFLGDDFHHNGAFRLSYGFEYSYMVENAKEANSSFPFPQYDLYEWYMKLGSLKNVNALFFNNRLPAWNDFAAHPNYDSFWKRQSRLNSVHEAQIPTLHVGGYYDQEDLNGPQIMYNQLEASDNHNKNFLILGPWNHGQWARSKGDSLGKISFDSKTSLRFQSLEKQWFDYWLKGIGDGQFNEANCFQTGSNEWKAYKAWPPKNMEVKKMYTTPKHTLSTVKPASDKGEVSYISDPNKPVPYRTRPIEATYGEGSRWRQWQVEDQRFVSTRPDVISFILDSLTSDLTITGAVKAHLFVSTTATDADFVVKLIDVYPNFDKKSLTMSGYEFPVTMEVFRGRFRKSFEKPEPFTPNKPEEITIDLHQVNHVFLKGHRIMVQIQSTWFPVIDRNPQKYVPNIFEANEGDFTKATHTVYCNSKYATYLELPVIKE
jgi:putative CocE/NonD family hydrolase